MSDAHNTVFISYRRSSGSFIARAIFEDLRTNGFDSFMDVESIDNGQFDTIILNQIAARTHFVLILSPGTLERCNEPGDWLRREIETAMYEKRNIVPVLVGDFTFNGTEKYLTGKLAELGRFNAVRMFHEYFDEAMERLRKRYLKAPQYETIPIKPVPAAEQKIVDDQLQRMTSATSLTNNLLLSPEVQLARALKLERRGQMEPAVEAYSKVIELNPDHPAIFTLRGKARLLMGDVDGALVDLDKAVRINERDIEAFIQRGLLYMGKENYEQALLDFKSANNLRPGDTMILACLAVVDQALEQYKEAERLWRLLLRIEPQFADAEWAGREFKWTDAVTSQARALLSRLK
jgi:tetratricopeptide (TPR) repeat protein